MNIASARPTIITGKSCASCACKVMNAASQMECRFNPPIASPIVSIDGQGRPVHAGTITVFPIVSANISCRQYKRQGLDDQLSGAAMEGAA